MAYNNGNMPGMQNGLPQAQQVNQSVLGSVLQRPVMVPASVNNLNQQQPQQQWNNQPSSAGQNSATQHVSDGNQVLNKQKLQDLAKEVDSTLQLDEDLEELILGVADDFIESTVNAACLLAKHRKSNVVEAKDLLLHLERNYNMWVPGFGSDELRPYKKAPSAEAHRQRMALIKKSLKKY